MTSGPAPRVSVVVPVFDPGPYIEPAIASILGQTLPPGAVEAIFVDDGSTDGTAERLDRLAADRPDIVRVVHIPPSGSPGRPRNVGIAAARGDYIQFLDADDELALDALERLLALADRNGSDIVVGRFVSTFHPFNQRIFERTVERTTLADMPRIAESPLHIGRLYRRAFLESEGIIFPEGWRMGEDQAFSFRALCRARVISILGDGRPCYHYHEREDRLNLSNEPIDPIAFFGDVRRRIDIVAEEIEPGELRSRLQRRFIRTEILNKFRGRDWVGLDAAARDAIYAEVRPLAALVIDDDIEAGLPLIDRLRADLILADEPDRILDLARLEAAMAIEGTIERAAWVDGRLELTVRAWMSGPRDGAPLEVRAVGDRWELDPTILRDIGGRPLDVTASVQTARLDVGLRETSSGLEHRSGGGWRAATARRRLVPVEGVEVDGSGRGLALDASLSIDPEQVHGRRLGAGSWAVRLSGVEISVVRHGPLGADRRPEVTAACRPALLGDPGRIVVPRFDADGLRLEVEPPPADVAAALAGRPVRVVADGSRLVLSLDVAASPGAGPLAVTLVVADPAGERAFPATLRAGHDGAVVAGRPTELAGLSGGPHPLLLRLSDLDAPVDVTLGTVRADGSGGLEVTDLARIGPAERLAATTRRLAARLVARLVARPRRWARGAFRRARRLTGR